MHDHLRRLDRVWIPDAVYFITACVHGRKRILDNPVAVEILHQEWASAADRHGWRIGRYVVMPDHVHFFCAEESGGSNRALSRFMNHWKEWTAKRIRQSVSSAIPFWQAGFFDHVLRHDESYAGKWSYVRENPVRAGLVSTWEQWPHQGFVDFDVPTE